MCHWGKWKRTNELTLTPIHLRTTAFSFQPAYFIKLRAKVISNKKPLVHLHSQQGGSVHAAAYIMFVLTTHPSFSPWRNGPTKFRSSVCVQCIMVGGGAVRELTYIIEVAVGSPFWAVPAFQGAWLREEEHSWVLMSLCGGTGKLNLM